MWPGLLIEEREQHSLLRADVLLPAKTVTGVECRVHKTYLGPGARPVEARHAARRLTRLKSINKSLQNPSKSLKNIYRLLKIPPLTTVFDGDSCGLWCHPMNN